MFHGIALVLFTIIILASKMRVPLVVIALFAGILFGKDVLHLIEYNDFTSARLVADYALVFVLFIAGFGTRKERLKMALAPAMTLATLGVIITAGITAALLYLFLKLPLMTAILAGCIVASTDAAAVFSILRTRSFEPKLSSMVEIESATNDPMGIVLTTIVVGLMASQSVQSAEMAVGQGQVATLLLWQITGGIGVGLLIGYGLVYLSRFVAKLELDYFYIYIIAAIMCSYSIADFFNASGILSAFFAGFVLGNSNIPHKSESKIMLDALTTISNVIIFVMLGLLVSPKELAYIYKPGIVLFVVLTFVARPAAVLVCTSFTKNTIKEKTFLCWSGLRGAVPIVLATYPAAAGIEGAKFIFNMVFFTVLLSLLVQGTTIAKLADKLKLTMGENFPKSNSTT